MSATAEQIYETSLAYLYEYKNKDKELRDFFLLFLNVTLQECLEVQNSILIFNEKNPLAAAPLITDIAQEVPYDDCLTRVAIPYNIAALYFQGDNKAKKAAEYRARYIAALQEYTKAISTDIEDIY